MYDEFDDSDVLQSSSSSDKVNPVKEVIDNK
jgi:hypothetical protein